MVLESLFTARKIESKPADMIILSLLVSAASLFLSYFIFPEYAGVIFPLLITVGMAPVFYRILGDEEKAEEKVAGRKAGESFFRRHGEAVWLFSLFFIGVMITAFAASLLLPEDLAYSLFRPQIDSIAASKTITGGMLSQDALSAIVQNNVRVMLSAFALSLFLSTGALWILGWNASVLGIYMASLLKGGLFAEFSSAIIGIIPHAPIEIAAYFLAGIAGGILSAGLIREEHNFRGKKFRLVLIDSIKLFAIAIIMVGAGALLEVYV
jgi:uncharacterized membrane protein SpoIIM required for sporulation